MYKKSGNTDFHYTGISAIYSNGLKLQEKLKDKDNRQDVHSRRQFLGMPAQ